MPIHAGVATLAAPSLMIAARSVGSGGRWAPGRWSRRPLAIALTDFFLRHGTVLIGAIRRTLVATVPVVRVARQPLPWRSSIVL